MQAFAEFFQNVLIPISGHKLNGTYGFSVADFDAGSCFALMVTIGLDTAGKQINRRNSKHQDIGHYLYH